MFFKKERMFESVFIGEKNGEKYYAVKEGKYDKYFIAIYFKNTIFSSNQKIMFDTVQACRKAFRLIKNK